MKMKKWISIITIFVLLVLQIGVCAASTEEVVEEDAEEDAEESEAEVGVAIPQWYVAAIAFVVILAILGLMWLMKI